MPMPDNSPRLAWLDAARGIGIILVVFGHVERGLVAAGMANGANWSTVDRALYTFHMPLFVLLAGVNVPRSLARGRARFLNRKLSTLAYPYVLWSLIQGSVLVELSRMTNAKFKWSALTAIEWQPIAQFWFLYALFVYCLIAAALKIRSAPLILLAITGMVVSVLVPDTQVFLHQLCYMFAFFVMGVLGSDVINNWQPKIMPAWLIGSAVVWVAAFQIVPSAGATPYLSPLAVPAALAGTLFILTVVHLSKGRAEAILAGLGRYSMSIYVMHIFAAAGARIVLTKSHFGAPVAVYLVLCLICGIAAPVLVQIVLDKAGLLPIFGLGKTRSRAMRGNAEAMHLAP